MHSMLLAHAYRKYYLYMRVAKIYIYKSPTWKLAYKYCMLFSVICRIFFLFFFFIMFMKKYLCIFRSAMYTFSQYIVFPSTICSLFYVGHLIPSIYVSALICFKCYSIYFSEYTFPLKSWFYSNTASNVLVWHSPLLSLYTIVMCLLTYSSEVVH